MVSDDELGKRFREDELVKVRDEALIYMCACPAQVAVSIAQLRRLHEYQRECEGRRDDELGVHDRIALAVSQAHAIMENCLDEILSLEGWDRQTLAMPPGLRQLQRERVLGDEV